MGCIVDINAYRHLAYKGDRNIFVTVCPDGNVIYNGRIMTLLEVTAFVLGEPVEDYRERWEVIW